MMDPHDDTRPDLGKAIGRAAEAQFFQPGCPMQYNRPLPPATN